MYQVKICHLYPDLLNLSGDKGNVITLEKRLQWRGVGVETVTVSAGEDFDYSAYDIIFVGGEPDGDFTKLMAELAKGNGAKIVDAVNAGKVILAVNGGYQILGKSYKAVDGTVCELLGAMDFETVGAKARRTCDCVFACDGMNIVAFENHAGKTYLGDGVKPLGNVVSGFGNNGEDGTEGARFNNVFATYGHGPLLPKNPQFADMIIEIAMKQKYPEFVLDALDDGFEMDAHHYIEQRLSK